MATILNFLCWYVAIFWKFGEYARHSSRMSWVTIFSLDGEFQSRLCYSFYYLFIYLLKAQSDAFFTFLNIFMVFFLPKSKFLKYLIVFYIDMHYPWGLGRKDATSVCCRRWSEVMRAGGWKLSYPVASFSKSKNRWLFLKSVICSWC